MDLQKLIVERLSSITFAEFARNCEIELPAREGDAQGSAGSLLAAVGEPNGGQ
jgi:hypothetical protein